MRVIGRLDAVATTSEDGRAATSVETSVPDAERPTLAPELAAALSEPVSKPTRELLKLFALCGTLFTL